MTVADGGPKYWASLFAVGHIFSILAAEMELKITKSG